MKKDRQIILTNKLGKLELKQVWTGKEIDVHRQVVLLENERVHYIRSDTNTTIVWACPADLFLKHHAIKLYQHADGTFPEHGKWVDANNEEHGLKGLKCRGRNGSNHSWYVDTFVAKRRTYRPHPFVCEGDCYRYCQVWIEED